MRCFDDAAPDKDVIAASGGCICKTVVFKDCHMPWFRICFGGGCQAIHDCCYAANLLIVLAELVPFGKLTVNFMPILLILLQKFTGCRDEAWRNRWAGRCAGAET